jgi:membrane associated rhomboid family serine protease
MVLLGYAGSRVERALGTLRFFLLTIAALGAYAVILTVSKAEVNGASVFVWAYAPPLAALHRYRRLTDRGSDGGDTGATPIVLAVMWVFVPVLMTTVPYGFGWSGGVVGAFVMANTFHISATVVGIGGAWTWRKHLSSAAAGTSRR